MLPQVPLDFAVVGVLDFGYSNRYTMVSLLASFPDDIGGRASFHTLGCHLCIFFDEVSVKITGNFFLIELFSYH